MPNAATKVRPIIGGDQYAYSRMPEAENKKKGVQTAQRQKEVVGEAKKSGEFRNEKQH